MEIGHKVSFIILVFWCFIIVLSSGFLLFYRLFFIFLSCILRPAFAPVYCLPGQLIIGVTWVNLVGWAGRGQCTDLASWPLDKMYMLLLAVSAPCLSWSHVVFMHWLTNISCPTSLSFYTPLRLLKFFLKNETIAMPFSNLRLISFASTIVSQSEYKWTDSRNYEP